MDIDAEIADAQDLIHRSENEISFYGQRLEQNRFTYSRAQAQEDYNQIRNLRVAQATQMERLQILESKLDDSQ